MHVVVAVTNDALRAAAARLSASGYEAVSVDGVDEVVRRVNLSSLTVALVDSDPASATAFSGLTSRLRRRVLVVQLGDDVTTADGTSAFIRGVNLLVATPDTNRIKELLDVAISRHRELIGLLEPELVR